MSVITVYSKEVGCAVRKHTVEGGTVYKIDFKTPLPNPDLGIMTSLQRSRGGGEHSIHSKGKKKEKRNE